MKTLSRQYKKVQIPEGTLLFRKAVDNSYYPSMFFGFDACGVYSSDYKSTPLQLWETKINLESTFSVKDLNPKVHYKTDLESCYMDFCEEERYYMDVKSRHNPNRDAFFEFLRANNIDSWVTTVNNNMPMELVLFTNDNSSLVSFKMIIENEKEGPLLDHDSFKDIIIL
ncbi:MAG: hypothetical protein ABJF27_15145 [Crocinitomicaceae bacterium]